MKRRVLQLVCMLSILAGLALVPATAQAKSSVKEKGFLLDGPVKFSTDLDGDGAKETIKISAKLLEGDYSFSSIKMAVTDNKKTVTTTIKNKYQDGYAGCTVNLVTLDSKHKFINLRIGIENDYVVSNKMYKYDSKTGKMKSVGNFALDVEDVNSCEIKSASADKVTVSYWAQPDTLGGIFFNLTYNYKDGKFVAKTKTVTAKSTLGDVTYPEDGLEKYFAKNKYKTAKKLTFYTKAAGDTKAFSVKKNKFVTLKKVKLYKGHIYGQFSYKDQLGWKKISGINPYRYDGTNIENTGWFYGVFYRLAG